VKKTRRNKKLEPQALGIPIAADHHDNKIGRLVVQAAARDTGRFVDRRGIGSII
jgi:hypothetical protein